MNGCIDRGLSQDGIMPGGLKVRRRARKLHDKLQEQWQQNQPIRCSPMTGSSIYAMAVNEENAAGGRVVTAPTNGAAGTCRRCCATGCISIRRPIQRASATSC